MCLPLSNISPLKVVMKVQMILVKMIRTTAKPMVSYPVILQCKFYFAKIVVLTNCFKCLKLHSILLTEKGQRLKE